jgi:hypothetical protein
MGGPLETHEVPGGSVSAREGPHYAAGGGGGGFGGLGGGGFGGLGGSMGQPQFNSLDHLVGAGEQRRPLNRFALARKRFIAHF